MSRTRQTGLFTKFAIYSRGQEGWKAKVNAAPENPQKRCPHLRPSPNFHVFNVHRKTPLYLAHFLSSFLSHISTFSVIFNVFNISSTSNTEVFKIATDTHDSTNEVQWSSGQSPSRSPVQGSKLGRGRALPQCGLRGARSLCIILYK